MRLCRVHLARKEEELIVIDTYTRLKRTKQTKNLSVIYETSWYYDDNGEYDHEYDTFDAIIESENRALLRIKENNKEKYKQDLVVHKEKIIYIS